jgi:hypothetical protein
MTTTPPAPEDAAAHEADEIVRRHRVRLERLAEVGMEMVEALRAEMIAAQGRGDVAAAGETARGFAHLARAVRHAIALDARLVRDARLGCAQAERDQWRDEARLGRRARKEEARELVQDIIAHAGESRGGLERRLHQRLDREDDRDTALFAPGAPLGPAIGRLCYELGVRPDWTRCDGEPWAPEAFDAYQALARERPLEVDILNFGLDAAGDPQPPTRVIFGPRRPSG